MSDVTRGVSRRRKKSSPDWAKETNDRIYPDMARRCEAAVASLCAIEGKATPALDSARRVGVKV